MEPLDITSDRCDITDTARGECPLQPAPTIAGAHG